MANYGLNFFLISVCTNHGSKLCTWYKINFYDKLMSCPFELLISYLILKRFLFLVKFKKSFFWNRTTSFKKVTELAVLSRLKTSKQKEHMFRKELSRISLMIDVEFPASHRKIFYVIRNSSFEKMSLKSNFETFGWPNFLVTLLVLLGCTKKIRTCSIFGNRRFCK